ncbi:MAG: hypothetical protein RMK65_02050 [Anaerolineae bacterium]|nr:hypothetical protein [Anaerolineae bacterium]MCX8066788.1 hypothetical protein [Anaerolineae bacterium]MDW7990926.1 hypothetical protein [Anaerolineae bacterium]
MSGPWTYPVVERGSKLGVHTIFPGPTIPYLRRLLESGTRFPVIKAVDGLGVLAEVKALAPQVITIGRVTSAIEAAPGIMGADLAQLADSLVQLVLNKIAVSPELQGGRVVDYWEIVNEPAPPGVAGYRRLAQLMILCMEKAERHGLKLGIFAFNAGTPEWAEMQAIVETGVFAKAREGGHILTLHEGVFHDWPIDHWWGHTIPGSPVVEGAGALCFRYRYLYHLLKLRGEVVPLVVSEFYPVRAGGPYTGFSPEEVARRVAWYDAEASKDYYHWAFCPFTIGPSPGWEDCNYEYAYPRLLDYMISVKNRENARPVPEIPLGLPREQYERTYVLLPPGAGREWVKAILDSGAWDRYRWTIGGSADDAGIGALNVRTVIAINPHLWPGDLAAFFQTYYPGLRYVPIVASTPDELKARLQSM